MDTLLLDEQVQFRIQQAEDYAVCFEQLISCTNPEIPDKGIIAGPIQPDYKMLGDKLPKDQIKFGWDNLHFAMNVETLLRLGFAGIERIARENADKLDGEESNYLIAIARCHKAMIDFMKAHADMAQKMADKSVGAERERLNMISHNCLTLSLNAPQAFAQAVQLFWIAWNIRGHGTIGRLDQHLYPFYRRDLDDGIMDRQKAFEILVELWEGFNRTGSGDTLMNLMIGGRDHKGNDQANDISYLMMDAAIKVRKSEPQISARIHAGTTESFFDKLAELQLLGQGQGAIYSDEALIPSLVSVGVPLESACKYANDGCTEVTIDGESGITFMTVEAVKSLELALFNGEENKLPGESVGRYINRDHQERKLHTNVEFGYKTGDFAEMTSFDQVYDAYINQYMYQLDRVLDRLCAHINNEQKSGVTSPFLAGTFPQCLETGLDPFRGGFSIPCYMIFSCSIPTVADGLSAIKKVIFDDRYCTPSEMLEALKANFEGYEPLRQHCLAAPKFGNDDDYVDEMASDIARRFCARVKQHPSPTGKPIWPALYNFLFNDTAKIVGATPDGRRWREPVSEHYSPTPGRAKNGATAVIKSAAKGPLAEACGSSIFHVSLDRGTATADDNGKALLKWLVKSAISLGVAVMDIPIYDVDMLKKARLHPEEYRDLIVRVWGFSARFVDLCDEMQDHIIQRAIQSS